MKLYMQYVLHSKPQGFLTPTIRFSLSLTPITRMPPDVFANAITAFTIGVNDLVFSLNSRVLLLFCKINDSNLT